MQLGFSSDPIHSEQPPPTHMFTRHRHRHQVNFISSFCTSLSPVLLQNQWNYCKKLTSQKNYYRNVKFCIIIHSVMWSPPPPPPPLPSPLPLLSHFWFVHEHQNAPITLSGEACTVRPDSLSASILPQFIMLVVFSVYCSK